MSSTQSSSKHRVKSRKHSQPRITTVNISKDGIEVPLKNRRKSKYRKSRRHSRKHSKILYEDPGEWDEKQRALADIYHAQSSVREKESAVKLCTKLVENFWDTVWDICSERFYHENAPATVTYELRDTWLRIIEANWLDQDLPQTDVRPKIFTPDEPPEPLITETPSTELFLSLREQPKREVPEEQPNVGGSGEPQATVEMEAEKSKDKMTVKGKPGAKGKTPPPVQAASTPKGQAPPAKKSLGASGRKKSGVGKNTVAKGKAAVAVKPKAAAKPPITTTAVEPEKALPPPSVQESKMAIKREPSKPQCIPPPPPPPPEIPVEILYVAPNYKGDALTPTDSREKRCGKRDAATSKSSEQLEPEEEEAQGEAAGQQEAEETPQEFTTTDTAPTTAEPREIPASQTKSKSGSRSTFEDTPDASGFHIKKGEPLESSKTDELLEPVNIVDRIDNLLAADSDHVVDILRPAEVEQLHMAGSLTFKVGDGEFGDHFKTKVAKTGAKKAESTKGPKLGKVVSGAHRGTGEKVKAKKPSQEAKKVGGKEERSMKLQQVASIKRSLGTKAK